MYAFFVYAIKISNFSDIQNIGCVLLAQVARVLVAGAIGWIKWLKLWIKSSIIEYEKKLPAAYNVNIELQSAARVYTLICLDALTACDCMVHWHCTALHCTGVALHNATEYVSFRYIFHVFA